METKDKQIWTSTIVAEEPKQSDELDSLAGRWGTGLNVETTNPFETYSGCLDVIFEKREFIQVRS